MENFTFCLKIGKKVTLNILVCILSYSKFRVYKLSLDKTPPILFHYLNEIFKTIEGVTIELSTDNMKTIRIMLEHNNLLVKYIINSKQVLMIMGLSLELQ